MRPIERAAFSALVLLGCHAGQPANPHPTPSRSPAPCRGEVGNAISVDQALAITEQRVVVTVKGYLVRVGGPCTLMNCPEGYHNCNTCEVDVRIADWRKQPKNEWTPKALRLYSSRVRYTCLSKGADTCAFDATGEHVLARGTLRYSEDDVERVALLEPEICELSP